MRVSGGLSVGVLLLLGCGGAEEPQSAAEPHDPHGPSAQQAPPAAAEPTVAPSASSSSAAPADGCDPQHPDTCVAVASELSRGGRHSDYSRIKQLLDIACGASHAEGCHQLGQFHHRVPGPLIGASHAVTFYQKACELKHEQSCFQSAHWLWIGAVGVEADPPRAQSIAAASCERSGFGSCGLLAAGLIRGYQVPRDERRAFGILQSNCQAGHGPGCTAVGLMQHLGRGTTRSDREAAKSWDKGCGQQEGQACALLGWLHDKGRGVVRDAAKARQLREKGCAHGYCLGKVKLEGGAAGSGGHRGQVLKHDIEGAAHVGRVAVVAGGVTDAKRWVMRMRAGFRRCYQHVLRKNPKAAGKMLLTIEIGANGRVRSAKATGNLPQQLKSCVSSRARAGQFDPPDEGHATLTVPLVFQSKPAQKRPSGARRAPGAYADVKDFGGKPRNANSIGRPWALGCTCSAAELKPRCALECPR